MKFTYVRSATSFTCSSTRRVGVQIRRTATILRVAFTRTIHVILGVHPTFSSMHRRIARRSRVAWGGTTASEVSSAISVTRRWSGSTTRTSIRELSAIAHAAIRPTSVHFTITHGRKVSLTSSTSSISSLGSTPRFQTSMDFMRSSCESTRRSSTSSIKMRRMAPRYVIARTRQWSTDYTVIPHQWWVANSTGRAATKQRQTKSGIVNQIRVTLPITITCHPIV